MAHAARVHHLLRAELRNGRVFSSAFSILLLPGDMILKRAVTGFATHARLDHGCLVGVVGLVVIFPEVRVVATGAHAVPIQAAPSTVPPLAAVAILVSKHIKPLITALVVGGLERLK